MLDELKALVAVVEERSLTKAAAKLFLTQSAISRRIQQLEDLLRTPLLDRTTRPPTPTAIGRRVYAQAVVTLRSLDSLVALTAQNTEPRGPFRIGIAHGLVEAIVVEPLRELRVRFPELDLQIRAAWSPEIMDDVLGGTLDAAVIMRSQESPVLASHHQCTIGSLDVVVVQSRIRPLVGTPCSVSDLSRCDWIMNPQGCGYRAELERVMGEHGDELRVGVDAYGTEMQLQLVAAGLGLSIVPKSILALSLHRETLSIVDVKDFRFRINVNILHQSNVGNLIKPIELLRHCFTAKLFSGKPPARRKGRD